MMSKKGNLTKTIFTKIISTKKRLTIIRATKIPFSQIKVPQKLGFIAFILLPSSYAYADIFHYSNFIPGDRAIGLGGAYAGVSDDAAGVIYNPAGLAFATTGDVSGSANAYYKKTITYKNIIDGSDFTEHSEGFVPSFFGGIQKLDNLIPGFAAGFAIYSPDNEVRDQNDFIASGSVRAFHRNVKLTATTLRADVAAALRISSRFSVGMNIGFLNINELSQEYQFSALPRNLSTTPYIIDFSGRIYGVDTSKISGKGDLSYIQSLNGNYKTAGQGIQSGLGTQIALGGNFVLGISAKTTFLLNQKFTYEGDKIYYQRFSNGQALTRDFLLPKESCPTEVTSHGGVCSDPANFDEVTSQSAQPLPGQNAQRASNNEPYGKWPVAIRGGFAWFATPRFLWTFDVEHNTAVNDIGLATNYRTAVTNFATGMEYYVTPSLPFRVGAFTNFDARPELQAGKYNSQQERIDYYGATGYLTWAQASSQVGFGSIYQWGRGKANKLGSAAQQDINASSASFLFSAAHML